MKKDEYRNILIRESLVYYEVDITERKILFGCEHFQRETGEKLTESYEETIEWLVNTVVFPNERELVRAAFSVENILSDFEKGSDGFSIEYRRLMGNGAALWVRGKISISEDVNSHHVMMCFFVNDINHRKMREYTFREHYQLDMLTWLPGKSALEAYIQFKMDHRATADSRSCFSVFSLYGFEKINQEKGILFGDALLAEFGCLLNDICEEGDIAGRVGGVKFVLFQNRQSSQSKTKKSADVIYNRLLSLRGETLKELGFSISVETVSFPEEGKDYLSFYKREVERLQAEPTEHTDINCAETDLARYICNILSNVTDVEDATKDILLLVVQQYGFRKVSMYASQPDGTFQCEFCMSDGKEQCARLEKKLEPRQIAAVFKSLDDSNVKLVVSDDNRKNVLPFGDSALQLFYGFVTNHVPCGFVCFESDHFELKETLETDQRKIQNISRILSVLQSGKTRDMEIWENNYLLHQVTDECNSCTYIIDPETHVLKYVNQNTLQAIPKATKGTICYKTIRGRTSPCEDCPIDYMVGENLTKHHVEMHLHPYSMWAQINTSLVPLPNGKVYGIFNGFDFSEHKREEQIQIEGIRAFTQDMTLYEALAASTDDYIFVCDMTTRMFYFPKKMVEEFGLPEQVIDQAIDIWAEKIHEEDRQMFLDEMEEVFCGLTDSHSMEYRVRNHEGVWIWVRSRGHIERNKNGHQTIFAGVLTNLENKKSKIDHITGLPDKYEFEVRTRALLKESVKKGVLLTLGLDNFRYINNLYGWDFGDSVLKESSERLISVLPENVQLYKLDGDKFGIFFADKDTTEVEAYYQSVVHIFKQSKQSGKHRYSCTISGGCAYLDNTACAVDLLSFNELFKQANLALEYSKREGKNRLTIFDEETMSQNDMQLMFLSKLHENVNNGCENFELYFQPQIDTQTLLVNSAEALLRWSCPDVGMVSPVQFIPLLEQSGLIHSVGRWVIREAMSACAKWRKRNPDFTVSVNLSYIQLQDQTFLPFLHREIEQGNIIPEMLHMELTESCIANGSYSLKEAFEEMRSMGFVLEMDDFGTGYSSLEILKNAPADTVKIDHAFVRNITKSKFDATFIQFVVTLCHSVGIKVCLEGVETWEEYYLVESMQLDLIQGFLFGKPQPKEEFQSVFIEGKGY